MTPLKQIEILITSSKCPSKAQYVLFQFSLCYHFFSQTYSGKQIPSIKDSALPSIFTIPLPCIFTISVLTAFRFDIPRFPTLALHITLPSCCMLLFTSP